MLKLIVKNFGVLKDIDIELNKTNLFIGDNGSGKSTLAKLITVITDFTLDEDAIIQKLQDFNIDFLTDECFIQLKENNEISIEIVALIVVFPQKRKEANKIQKEFESYAKFNNTLHSLESKSSTDEIIGRLLKADVKEEQDLISFMKNKELRATLSRFDKDINTFKSKYIPAERNLISLFNQSLSNMINAEIPLPKTLLEFSAEYNSAKKEIKELDILNMKYKNVNFQDRIYYGDYKDNSFLPLENSSSGIQSVLPLYLTLKYFATKHNNIIIEEPELNLYPKSQIDTVKYMIENRGEISLSIMTHSPYILSILNVLIFAYKASSHNDVLKEKISAIIPKTQHINPNEFNAYLIKDGTSISIKGKSTGMIQSNVIDDISDTLDDNYNELMEIYREFKSDK